MFPQVLCGEGVGRDSQTGWGRAAELPSSLTCCHLFTWSGRRAPSMTRTAPGGEAGARLTGSQAISLVHLMSTVSDTCQVWHGMASLPTHEELLWNSLIVT